MQQESDGPPGRPARRALRIVLWVVLLLGILVAGLWLARRPIATRVIDRELARAGVPARYGIADLGLGRQRLTNVVIGDPARPDLVADWVETGTRLTWDGASVTAIRAGRVRLRGRLVDGRVSLGALDRLLPPTSGEPFALPRLHLDVTDARMRLETPAGVVGLKLSGRGRLDDGFSGRLAAAAPRLEAAGCIAQGLTAAVRVGVDDAAPAFAGPVRAERIDCEAGSVAQVTATLKAAATARFDEWRGSAQLAIGQAAAQGVRVASLQGAMSFNGDGSFVGDVDLVAAALTSGDAAARSLALKGQYRVTRSTVDTASPVHFIFAGQVRGRGVSLRFDKPDLDAFAGTPLAPFLHRASTALVNATDRFDVDSMLAFRIYNGIRISSDSLQARAGSGARLNIKGGSGVTWWSSGIVKLDTGLTFSGGGLPSGRVTFRQEPSDDHTPVQAYYGLAHLESYDVDGASLALSPMSIIATPGFGAATQIKTRVIISGPLGDGRVDGLSIPITLLRDEAGRFALNPGCSPVAFRHLAVSGLVLAPTRLNLCATGRALVTVDGGRIEGGARIAAPRIAGRLGSTPVTLAASGGEIALGVRGFALRNVAARIGNSGRVTRIDASGIEGRILDGAVAGRFTGAGGQIAKVPLLLSDAAGEWRLASGVLTLDGGAIVADAEGRRFRPLRGEDLAFRLADNRIAFTGSLVEPATRARIAGVRIAHDLARGAGDALLDVPGVTFDERLQPEALTPLTFGVIADVRGRVSGEGRIAWTPDGVTSAGAFRTDGLDLAAAFGPVTELAGTIRFDDLLALRSAPGQVATIAAINPGVAVTDGVIRYQTLPETRVRVEGGRWPFAGGMLTLEPTLLDFSRPTDKRLTFRVAGVEAAQFLQQFDFDNLSATGVFDGVLPMAFDERGGRIEDGRLTVRAGGGTLAYVGAVGQEALGFWGDLAFQALKSLRYRNLDIVMNGPLSGEMVTQVRFAGVAQGEGAKSNFLIRRLQRLPFVFNVRIRAPFRGLIDSARGFYDPSRLIGRNLPVLLEEQNRRSTPVQPSASEKVR